MAVTIVVRGIIVEGEGAADAPSLTLDSPRIVIGRGEGCEVRLPDPSVSHRHASLRQRGGEYVLVDENSTNGTFLHKTRLAPQAPQVVRSGELVRVGRVFLELRFEPALVTGNPTAAAKELALSLVEDGLRAQGEEPEPRITVLDGPDAGQSLVLAERGRAYLIGRGKDADLVLTDPNTSRRHLRVTRKGEALAVQDLGDTGALRLDGAAISGTEAVWRPGQEAGIGRTHLGFAYAAAEALAELERSPDEPMREGETPEPPRAPEETPSTMDATPPPPPSAPLSEPFVPPPPRVPAKVEGGGFGALDGVVVLLALGVLALSAFGAWWLFWK